MIRENYPPDPDRLPHIGSDELRKIRTSRITDEQYTLKEESEREGVRRFVSQQDAAISQILGNTGLHPIEPKDLWFGVATTPIDILSEPIDQVVATAVSIGEAADKMEEPILYLPWLNFMADHRREQDKIIRATKKAELLEDAIRDTVKGHNVTLNTAVDHLPHGTTIAGIRQRMLLGALGLIIRHATSPENVYSATRRPYLSVDADTTISDDTLVIAKEPLKEDRALFVSGNLCYVGGIMDKDLQAVRQESKEMRLLYLVEHMRRLMLNSLSPTQQRGYLPETGMITTLSTLARLGGYNVHAENNESYWLEVVAEEATKASLGCKHLQMRTPPTLKEMRTALISVFHGQTLESITRYESYSINTSIEGVERSARKFGAAAVVAFDQGSGYTMRTQFNELTISSGHSRSNFSSQLIMNAAYSYYKLCGGELTAEGLLMMNDLINNLHLVEKGDLMPGRLAWVPQYIAKEEWPTEFK